ncbi:methyltransferase-like protein 22 [Periophthalmus magnuspinnatus]|uniref:methyltransferase-like protein 22 n=1 Tax=Periophthalmus magnuspinnatus TaxID=409849 RepID=UPI00145BDB87|nr:methyltransferase-like protein 22 [Periophthalmus magnuspinnatus]
MELGHRRSQRSPPPQPAQLPRSDQLLAAEDLGMTCGQRMDSVTFHHDSVLSDVHMLQPRARHLMTRLNRTGQPVFMSKFRILSRDQVLDQTKDPDHSEERGSPLSRESEEGNSPMRRDPDERGSPVKESPEKSDFGEGPSRAKSPEKDQSLELDEDGDFELIRPRRQAPECGRDEVCPVLLSQTDPQDPEDPTEDNSESADVIMIEHTMATLLEDVGKQVWRGALFLADFILSEPRTFRGATVLELGGGTGLTSILTATVAKRVYCTDVGEDLLSMCRRNISLNKHMMELSGGEVKVRQLDWLQRDLCTDPEEEFSWSEEEVADLYDHTTVIIAADVVYDDDLTDAFFRTLYQLCSSLTHSCDVYISIEKRLNFTLRHLEVCCEAYEHFHHCLQQLQDLEGPVRFNAQSVAPRFPQSLIYERMDQLELWKVSATYITNLQETCTDH